MYYCWFELGLRLFVAPGLLLGGGEGPAAVVVDVGPICGRGGGSPNEVPNCVDLSSTEYTHLILYFYYVVLATYMRITLYTCGILPKLPFSMYER